ncbi:MAG: hypothetical protein Q9172_006872 [Xanthocarpia lactea]
MTTQSKSETAPNWDAAIRKGTILFQQLQSGCYPDTQNPIDREGLEAIGFTIRGEDQTNDWPPTFVKRSAMETKEVKMFKWTETEDAYWRARSVALSEGYAAESKTETDFIPWQDHTDYNNEYSPQNGLIAALDIKEAPDETIYWSDATFAVWEAVTAFSRTDIKNLRYIAQHAISNPFTQSIVHHIIGGKPSITKMFGPKTDVFLALLGTPNGADSARLLMQHKRQLGHKTVFQAVVVGSYPNRWLYNGPDVIFEIRDYFTAFKTGVEKPRAESPSILQMDRVYLDLNLNIWECTRSRRECNPSDGLIFRHHQNASMNSTEKESERDRNLEGFYAYKDTFDQDNVWVDVPRTITFVRVLDPFAASASPEPEEEGVGRAPITHQPGTGGAERHLSQNTAEAYDNGLEALSAAALYLPSEDSILHQNRSLYPANSFVNQHQGRAAEEATSAELSTPPQTNFASTTGNLGFILNPSTSLLSTVDHGLENIHGVPDVVHVAQGQLKAGTETSHHTAFLLRHFSEVTGRWMDLFDQTTFFGSHIPVKSISNPLLKHSACAYAAKQLGRVSGAKATVGGLSSHQASMEQWDSTYHRDWALLAAQHYDHAISLLMEALHWDHSSSEADSSEIIDKRHYAPRTVDGMVNERKLRRRKFGSAQSTARSDDVLAAVAILCEYESLDASTAAWTRHLSGTKTLLDVVEVGMMPLDVVNAPFEAFSTSSRKTKLSQARKAVFWNFARQDLFAAFLYECRTRLDTDDVPMWTGAGLLLDEDDLVVASNTAEMNLICANSDSDGSPGDLHRDDPTFEDSNTGTQNLLSQKWQSLSHEMETWFNGLPETFMPSAIIHVSPHGANLTEVWLSIPVCAATTLTWHFSQVLMLVNRPHDVPARRRTTIADRVNSSRDFQSEITYHSRQILGLCLARPDASVRIYALHPLFVAGQCLSEEGERRVIIDLLRGIEKDLGWATEYRVQQLLQQWGWQMDGDEVLSGEG